MPPVVTKPLVMIDGSIFPGLSYKGAKNTFSNSVRKNDVGAQVEFAKIKKGLGSPVIDVTIKKGSLVYLVYLIC